MDLMFDGFVVLGFVAVFLAVEGSYLWWTSAHGGEAQRIARRLRMLSGGAARSTEQVSILKQRRFAGTPAFDSLLQSTSGLRRLDQLLQQAGARWSVAQVLLASAALCAGALVLLQLWTIPALAAALAVPLCALAPLALLLRKRVVRLKKIEHQLPEVADFLGRALRAGHTFSNVLQMAGAEMPEPVGAEFRAVHEEIHYGVSMSDALHNLATRVPLTDLRYLVIAVLIQRESGGNLTEILGSISRVIRARLKLVDQVQVFSAEGRMSAWVMGALPFAVMLLMSITSPDYIRVLWTDPTGVPMLWAGGGMIAAGALWMRVVIRIRV